MYNQEFKFENTVLIENSDQCMIQKIEKSGLPQSVFSNH